MDTENFSKKLALVARAYDTTPEVIRHKLTYAIEEGRHSQDPQVQALWASIPRSGAILTAEDFVEYLAQTLPQPFDA